MYYVYQSSFTGEYLKTPLECSVYICNLFGLDVLSNSERIEQHITQKIKIWGKTYTLHEDLQLKIIKVTGTIFAN